MESKVRPAYGRDAENLEVIFRYNKSEGELRVACSRRQQSQLSKRRSSLRSAPTNNVAGVRQPHMVRPKSDEAAEGMNRIPVRFEVGIAEGVFGGTRLSRRKRVSRTRSADHREVNHFAGIARIERPGNHRFVASEDRGVYPNTKRQGEDRDSGEPGVAAQHAGSVTQVLEYAFGQDHRTNLTGGLSLAASSSRLTFPTRTRRGRPMIITGGRAFQNGFPKCVRSINQTPRCAARPWRHFVH